MTKLTTTDMYAYFLAEEMTFYVSIKEKIIDFDRLPQEKSVIPVIQEIHKEYESLTKKLQKEGQFFHKDSGSIFMDYKNLRNSVAPNDEEREKIAQRFSTHMSKDEFLREAKQVVEEWQSRPGIEGKI